MQELGSVIQENCMHNTNHVNNDLFGDNCKECGITITFADDASLVLKCKRGEDAEISTYIDRILSKLEGFLKVNCLQLNVNKTQLLRVTTRQQLTANQGKNISLTAVDKEGKWRMDWKSGARKANSIYWRLEMRITHYED